MMRQSLAILALVVLPYAAQAAITITSIFESFATVLATFSVVGFAIAFGVFLWGLIKLIRHAGDDAQLSEGRKRMVWGVVGLFVMVSIWSIVWVMQTLILGNDRVEECETTRILLNGTTFRGDACLRN